MGAGWGCEAGVGWGVQVLESGRGGGEGSHLVFQHPLEQVEAHADPLLAALRGCRLPWPPPPLRAGPCCGRRGRFTQLLGPAHLDSNRWGEIEGGFQGGGYGGLRGGLRENKGGGRVGTGGGR